MSQHLRLTAVAGAATLLAALPLSTIFALWTWFYYATLTVVFVAGAATLVRMARGPVWVQLLAMLAALQLILTWIFPSGGELLKVIPTAQTWQHFNQLLIDAGEQIRHEGIPVPDFDGLLLLSTVGIGLVAVLVEVTAVGLRKPALAGLPMLAVYSVPVAVLADGLTALGFLAAAAGYLWLLVTDNVDRVRRFGRRFTGEGRDVDVWEPSPLAAAGRRLAAVSIAVAMLIPLAVPGMTSGLLERFGGAGTGRGEGGAGAGPGGNVDLFALLTGALNRERQFPMVRVTTTDPNPYYLRFGVADQVSLDGFRNRGPGAGIAVNRGIRFEPPPNVDGVVARAHRATIEVLDFDMPLAPAYRQLVDVSGLDNTWFRDDLTEQIFSRRSSIDAKRYSIDFVRVSYTPAALRSAPAISVTDRTRADFTTVPVVPQVSELVAALTAGRDTQYDQVRAIYDYFSPDNGFSYSLLTEPGSSGNAIVDFLSSRKGFCVQYAAALAWLVRAAGFPARVAFGFTRGSGPQDGVYTLTNYNLHAWTEVYFARFGWVPFDATPAAAVVGSVPSQWAPDPTNPDGATGEETEPATGGSVSPGASSKDPFAEEPTGGAPPGEGAGRGPWLPIGGAVVLVVGMIVLLAPALRRTALRRQRRSRSGQTIILDPEHGPVRPAGVAGLVVDPAGAAAARADAHAAWAELVDTMIDFRVPVEPAETPRATAWRLGRLPALAATGREHLALLGTAEERARYVPTPLLPDRLDAAVDTVRQSLTSDASRRDRLLAVLMPRSVLLRWRAGAEAWLGQVITTMAHWRDRVSAVASPRRLLARSTR